jgi:thiol:disulfide interchange protein DsbD
MRIPDGWYAYWRQPSDSGSIGQPLKVKWTLPAGVTVGELSWPMPERKFDPTLNDTSYVYHQEAVLLVPLMIAADVGSGPLELRADLHWQECTAVRCVPAAGVVQTSLTLGTSVPSDATTLGIFGQARDRLPTPARFSVGLKWLDPETAVPRRFSVEFNGRPGVWDFFPHSNTNLLFGEFGASVLTETGGRFRVEKKAQKTEGLWPSSLRGLVARLDEHGKPIEAYEATAVEGGLADVAGTQSPVGTSVKPSASFLLMLSFAFIGGLILNIMPCVLPVIALKILGFVRQSQEEPGRVRKLGMAYGLGVLSSFLILAVLVISVKAATGRASWGMQFQDPRFLIVMTGLVTLVSLNLFGVFEVHLGGDAMTVAGSLARREGLPGAFANGVLATVLATPCTAPFLAPALGYAFAQPAPSIVLFFLTIGVGLATPYVILCWHPAWLKLLPKPGAWMEKFKIAMGFPMLATTVWLYSVAVGHFGEDGMLWLGLFLVGLGLGAWIFGEFVQRGGERRGLAWGAMAVTLVLAYGFILEHELDWRSPVAEAEKSSGASASSGAAVRDRHKLPWEPWSEQAVAAARAAGKPVLVDFTAKWCATCKVNKATSIEVPSVLEKVKSIGAATFIGDFTREDPVILKELQKYGRAGVPLVLVYSKNADRPPEVLPEFLTQRAVLEALTRAVQ